MYAHTAKIDGVVTVTFSDGKSMYQGGKLGIKATHVCIVVGVNTMGEPVKTFTCHSSLKAAEKSRKMWLNALQSYDFLMVQEAL
jgi:hypothetical protein